jgi:hypothetical protein
VTVAWWATEVVQESCSQAEDSEELGSGGRAAKAVLGRVSWVVKLCEDSLIHESYLRMGYYYAVVVIDQVVSTSLGWSRNGDRNTTENRQ